LRALLIGGKSPQEHLLERRALSEELVKAIAGMREEEAFWLVREMVEGGSEPMAILDAAGADCMPNRSALRRLPVLGKLRAISRA
jgi:hypothetical protein